MHQLYSVITTGLIGLLVVGGTAWAGAAGEAKTTRVATGLCLSNARLSPIGDRLAVTRRNCDHDPHLSDFEPRVELLISEIGSSDFRSVLAATDIDYVSWSADGKQILARAKADGKHQIMLIDVDSETNRQLDLLPTQSCWSPDGRIIATSRRGGILLFDLTTTDSTILRLPDSTVGPRRMDWSPTGRHILFTIGRSSNKPCPLWTVAVDGSTAPMLIDTAVFSGRWCPDGDGVNVLQCGPRLNKSLVRIPIDPETGAPQGDGTTLLQGIEGDGSFTVSADGRRLLYEEEVMGSDVWLFERTTSGSYVKKLLHSDNRPLRSPAISRDGEKLLCVREFNSGWGPSDIYVFDLTSGEADSVTTTASFTPSAAWSPDGRFIALPTGEGDYCSESYLTAVPAAGGPHRVFETEVTRRCGPQIAWQPMEFISYFGKTNKNRSCYYPDVDSSGLFYSLDTLMLLPEHHSAAIVSPDGRMAAVYTHGDYLGIIPLADPAGYYTIRGDFWPLMWSTDGEVLFVWKFERDRAICRLALGSREPETILELSFDTPWDYFLYDLPEPPGVAIDPSGERIVYIEGTNRSDIWLVEDFDPGVE